MTRSDSTASNIVADSMKKITPPLPLENFELPFWEAITSARATWTNIDLMHAVNLARCMASIENNQKLLREEGDVLVNARGTQIMNPRFTVLEQLSRRSVSLSSKIQVHAAATIGESENNRNKNAAKNKAGQALEVEEDADTLIARPH